MRFFKGALLLSLAMVLATSSLALAQSAGDDQYVDPFQNDGGEQQGGNGSGDNADSQGGGGGDQPTTAPAPTEIPEASAEGSVPSESVPPSDTTASEGEALPRTGLPAVALAAIGTFLLGGGAALRRRA